MKKIKTNYAIAAALCFGSLLGGCASSDEPVIDHKPSDSFEGNTCYMTFQGSRPTFDSSTRADESWKDGDKLYIYMGENMGVAGMAEYSQGKWIVNYSGSLSEGEGGACRVVYFDSPEWISGYMVSLTERTGIYETSEGTYSFADGALSVVATLTPKTGRIRFAGSDAQKITVAGITYYSSFDSSTGKFVKSNIVCSETVADGYTPYIYGEFTNSAAPFLTVITSDNAFVRHPDAPILAAGESGYMTIPSEQSFPGWQNVALFMVNGVEFTMIPVKYEKGNFLLAQTETTVQLYNAVNNTSSTDLKPYSTDRSTWLSWLDNLKIASGLEITVPTVEQWQFAYEGGILSKGYKYAGSNTLSDVAWYRGNSNSNLHAVATLQPNELGFYDMAGSAGEMVKDGDDSYFWYGGDYYSYADNCLVSSYVSYNSSYYHGLRFLMNF